MISFCFIICLQVYRRLEQVHAPITAMVVTEEHCFLVGLQDGSLILWSPSTGV
jgi:hypothetical protein